MSERVSDERLTGYLNGFDLGLRRSDLTDGLARDLRDARALLSEAERVLEDVVEHDHGGVLALLAKLKAHREGQSPSVLPQPVPTKVDEPGSLLVTRDELRALAVEVAEMGRLHGLYDAIDGTGFTKERVADRVLSRWLKERGDHA